HSASRVCEWRPMAHDCSIGRSYSELTTSPNSHASAHFACSHSRLAYTNGDLMIFIGNKKKSPVLHLCFTGGDPWLTVVA
ncbi:hypothetical protein HAX54_045743, partial [Datura stramonium]|nr:hypothetical protein [Datura stramonium]